MKTVTPNDILPFNEWIMYIHNLKKMNRFSNIGTTVIDSRVTHVTYGEFLQGFVDHPYALKKVGNEYYIIAGKILVESFRNICDAKHRMHELIERIYMDEEYAGELWYHGKMAEV
jgi:hypothetical protein